MWQPLPTVHINHRPLPPLGLFAEAQWCMSNGPVMSCYCASRCTHALPMISGHCEDNVPLIVWSMAHRRSCGVVESSVNAACDAVTASGPRSDSSPALSWSVARVLVPIVLNVLNNCLSLTDVSRCCPLSKWNMWVKLQQQKCRRSHQSWTIQVETYLRKPNVYCLILL